MSSTRWVRADASRRAVAATPTSRWCCATRRRSLPRRSRTSRPRPSHRPARRSSPSGSSTPRRRSTCRPPAGGCAVQSRRLHVLVSLKGQESRKVQVELAVARTTRHPHASPRFPRPDGHMSRAGRAVHGAGPGLGVPCVPRWSTTLPIGRRRRRLRRIHPPPRSEGHLAGEAVIGSVLGFGQQSNRRTSERRA